MKFNKKLLIEDLERGLVDLKSQLVEKRISLGEADSAKESRFPSLRNELEDSLKMLEDKIFQLETFRKELLNLGDCNGLISAGCVVKFVLNKELWEIFVCKSYSDPSQDIYSVDAPLFKALLGKPAGFKGHIYVNDHLSEIEILEVMSPQS